MVETTATVEPSPKTAGDPAGVKARRVGVAWFRILALTGLMAVLHLRLQALRPSSRVAATEPTIAQVQALFPEAAEMGRMRPGERFEVRDGSGRRLGDALCTSPAGDGFVGYGGPVPCLIGFAPEGTIRGVHLLDHAESPSFVDYMIEEGLLGAWNGLQPQAAIGQPVDAVSGATLTSDAVIGNVRAALAAEQEDAAEVVSGRTRGHGWRGPLLWLVPALGLACFLFPRRLRRLRPLVLGANVAVLGFWQGAMLSLPLFQGWISAGRHAPGSALLPALAALAVLLPILWRRDFYCTCVCPYGSAQDLVGRLWRWRRPRVPGWVTGPLRLVRGIGLLAAAVLTARGLGVDLAGWEPFAAFQWRLAPGSALVLAAGFLALAVLVPRLWCRCLCPTGAILSDLSGRRPAGGAAKVFTLERGILVAALLVALPFKPTPGQRPPAEAVPDDLTAPGQTPETADVPGFDALPSQGALDVIHSRRSVRHYTGQSVSGQQLDTLVRAAMAAPSAGNAQPWAFVIVDERDRLARLADALPYGKMLAHAAAGIVVCGALDETLPGPAADLWVQDCAAAAQNALLAAEAIGLGAVWVGVHPYADRIAAVRDICALPERVVPLCVISVGYSAGIDHPKDKYAPEKVYWNAWGLRNGAAPSP